MNILNRILGKKSSSGPLARFDKVLASLTIDGAQALYVLLAEDGTVNRLGDGSIDCSDRDMLIGRTSEPLFAEFMAAVDPAIFAHKGAYDIAKKEAKLCELRLLFGLRGSDACEGFQFRYGLDSQGPPKEIRDLVVKAVALTNAWHAQQKTNAKSK